MRKLFFGLWAIVAIGLACTACNGRKDKEDDKDKELKELRQLADMDRREMENQYEQFALQYDELKKGVKNDSLLRQLGEAQARTKSLLAELRQTKATDAAEICRLKKELETVRAVLRSYIIQVDSLTRENGRLTNERDVARSQLSDANVRINTLDQERAKLSDKVAIAAQLNASGIVLSAQKKNGKGAKKTKDIARFAVSFTINRNVTAGTGERRVYVRLMSPSGAVVGANGNFTYEHKSLECSASKLIEYTGEEQHVSVVIAAGNDFLAPGRYSVHLFCDGQMIGSSTLNIEQ